MFKLKTILFLSLIAPLAWSQQAQLPNRDEALSAYAKFAENPIANLNQAPIFLNFIQNDGEAHIVLDNKLTTWMYEEHAPEVRAVLYSAYMGSNMNAQLSGQSSGDDSVAGMRGVLNAYDTLKLKYPTLNIPMLEKLSARRAAGSLAAAIGELQSP